MKLGTVTVVGLDTLSKPLDLGFKRSRTRVMVMVRVGVRIVARGSEIMPEYAGV